MEPSENWVENRIRREYLEWRFRAHKNLIQILGYYNARYQPEVQQIDFNTVEEYAQAWGEVIDKEQRQAILQRDAGFEIFLDEETGTRIALIYLDGRSKKGEIKGAIVKERLAIFLNNMFQERNLSEDAIIDPIKTISEGKNVGKINMDINLQIIFYSEFPLETSTMNKITYYDELVTNPIRHFTINELQFNPTLHRTGPKLVKVLNSEEVQDLIDRQIGLTGAEDGSRLGGDLQDRLRDEDLTADERHSIELRLRNLALSKLPTINYNDPWVKWRGYRLGNILYIERRAGLCDVSYRLVVKLSKAASVKKT